MWVTLEGARMAEGGSTKPELAAAPAAKVEAGEPREPLAELEEPADESHEGMTKLAAAASAWDSMLPMASYMGLLKSLLPSEVTSWRPKSLLLLVSCKLMDDSLIQLKN